MKVSEAIKLLESKVLKSEENLKHFPKESQGYAANEARIIAYNIAINKLEQIDEPQAEKVEVTERQAQLLEAYEGETLYALLGECDEYEQELLAKAYLYGYTVKPKRWVVKDRKGECVYELRLAYTDTTMVNTNKTGIDGLVFTNRAKAEAVAVLVEGSVEEV